MGADDDVACTVDRDTVAVRGCKGMMWQQRGTTTEHGR